MPLTLTPKVPGSLTLPQHSSGSLTLTPNGGSGGGGGPPVVPPPSTPKFCSDARACSDLVVCTDGP